MPTNKTPGVDELHPKYTANEPDWLKIRDVVAGERRMKNQGKLYLPALDTENSKATKSYTERATFYGATGRTLDGYMGSVFRKPTTITLPPTMEPLLDNVDGAGTKADQFIKTVVNEVLMLNRCGILLDLPPEAPANALPYLSLYTAEAIRDWRVEMVDGKRMLTMVILREVVDQPDSDGFGHVVIERRRVLRLVHRPGINPVYTIEIWEKRDEDWVIVTPAFNFSVRGNTLDYIPFMFLSDEDTTPEVKKSAILDLVDVNISHFRNSADLEHGAHYTALPTPWISGISGEDKPSSVPLGPTECIVLPLEGEAGMLEFTGEGLKALESRAKVKESQMSVLGAKILEANKAGVEAAETQKLRQSADKSILAGVVGTCSAGLTIVFSWAHEWQTGKEPAEGVVLITINDEFFEASLTGQDILALVEGWQSGAYSQDSMLRKFQKAGIIERSPEEEIDQMASEPEPTMPGMDGGEEGQQSLNS